MSRKAIPKKIRMALYEKYNHRCGYCGCEIAYKDMQVDHLKPVYVHGEYLGDMQEYSQLKDRVKNIFGGTMTLKDVVGSIERVSKLQKSNPFNARVLTYDEAVMWNEYRKIGTPEECKNAMEKQKAKKPVTYKGTNRADCPICGATVRGISKPFGDWCSHCGHKLSWEDS